MEPWFAPVAGLAAGQALVVVAAAAAAILVLVPAAVVAVIAAVELLRLVALPHSTDC